MIRTGCIVLCLLMIACTKPSEPSLSFRINGARHIFQQVQRAYGEIDCRVRIYEIAAEHGDRFFKINMAAGDTLKPGTYVMGDQPSITESGKATFWYTSNGYSYIAKPFVITVHSYRNRHLVASFSGGAVTEGKIDLMLEER